MQARLNSSLPPAFWELDPIKQFQPLCTDILNQEPGISTADEYGKSGQSQLGIDIWGKNSSGKIIVVAQCKCYKTYKAKYVTEAADEFYKYYQDWKEKEVTRFILIVACDLSDKKIQDEINNQKTRFEQERICFEAWSGSILRNKLMPHRAIGERHIHSQEILRNIYGSNIKEVVFNPNASVETTLQQLRDAVRKPKRYYGDIKDLFTKEARKFIDFVQSYPLELQTFNKESYEKYLQPLIDVSERLVRLIAELIKLDRQDKFHDILIKTLKIIAQDPVKMKNGSSSYYLPGMPEVCLYPLALVIYTVYIMGIEHEAIKLLQDIPKIPFRSERLELNYLPNILWMMYLMDELTTKFFRKINDSVVPIPKSIENILRPWLENYVDFWEDSWYKGEFILGLTMQSGYKYNVFPTLYVYDDKAIDILENFIGEKQLLKELFPDIEDRLKLFDQLSPQAARTDFGRMGYGFYGKALNLYLNS